MATEKFVIQLCGWLIGIPLEILIIHALLRGAYRRYPVVFFYVLASLVTTLVEIPLNAQSWLTGSAAALRNYAKVYWINDWTLQVVVFALVLSLIDQAMAESPARRLVRISLAGGALLCAGITFLIEYRPLPAKFGMWMTPWTRDLGVCAAILDLALWMMLIASRKSDRRLLMISGALGMQFTGEAIGSSLLTLSTPNMMELLALIGAVVVMLANLAFLYVWWQAFRTARNTASVPAG